MIPAQIVRSPNSPTFRVSLYSLSAPGISSAFWISATRRSSFAKSSNPIVFTFSIDLFCISSLSIFGFGASNFSNRIGAFLILLVLKTLEIFSAVSGMKGERSFAISLIASTN